MVDRRRPCDERHCDRANSRPRFVALLSDRARNPLGRHPLPARYRPNAHTPNIGDWLAIGGFRDGFGRRPPAYCRLPPLFSDSRCPNRRLRGKTCRISRSCARRFASRCVGAGRIPLAGANQTKRAVLSRRGAPVFAGSFCFGRRGVDARRTY